MRKNTLTAVLDHVQDPVLLIEKKNASLVCSFCNKAAQRYFFSTGDQPTKRVAAIALNEFFPEPVSLEKIRGAIAQSFDRALKSDPASAPSPLEVALEGPFTGVESTLTFRFVPLTTTSIALYGRVTPVKSRRQEPDLLEYQDATTGLMNRQALKIIVQKEISRAQRDNDPMACLFLMLHNFKEINQHHGHHVGDLLLENTGVRVREVVRQSDYVFRWEGTNLVVLLPRLATNLDVAIVAEKLHEAVVMPYRFRELDIAPGCHIGISLFPDDATTYEELINRANSAVIEAERQQIPFVLYDNGLHTRAVERLTVRSGIQRAFEKGEFEVYYQPILFPDGRIAGAEALMRWNHAERGVLSPESFIGIAEESHLITLIDKVAIYSVCRSLANWNRFPDLFISLNISAKDLLDSTLASVVKQAIEDSGLRDPSRIRMELTESRLVARTDVTSTSIAGLQDIGVETWIDDFGRGQSSLSYLKHLPVTTVKIDRDFIRDIDTSAEDLDYLQSIVTTIRSRGKNVVMEGISTAEQHQLVASLPISYLQGFYFAGPMRAKQFEQLLDSAAVLPLH
jgi:diguanylate cyclase (GGDEF)-like protein